MDLSLKKCKVCHRYHRGLNLGGLPPPPPTYAHLGGWLGNICKLFNQCVPISNQSTQEFVSTPIFYLSANQSIISAKKKTAVFFFFSWFLVLPLISWPTADLYIILQLFSSPSADHLYFSWSLVLQLISSTSAYL